MAINKSVIVECSLAACCLIVAEYLGVNNMLLTLCNNTIWLIVQDNISLRFITFRIWFVHSLNYHALNNYWQNRYIDVVSLLMSIATQISNRY